MLIAILVANLVGLAVMGGASWHACKAARAFQKEMRDAHDAIVHGLRDELIYLLEHIKDGHEKLAEHTEIHAQNTEAQIREMFQSHADQLRQTVEDVRSHTREMHDTAMARAVSNRVVPTRN